MNRALDAASKAADARFYESMRNPSPQQTTACASGPKTLTVETVASWIMANVAYPHAADAHNILRAFQLENNAQ